MKLRNTLWIGAAFTVPFFASTAAAESAVPVTEKVSRASLTQEAINGVSSVSHSSGNDASEALGETVIENTAAVRVAPVLDQTAKPIAASGQTFDLAGSGSTAVQAGTAPVVAVAQYSGTTAASEKREDSYSVLLNQDAFFGFYPSFNGLIPIGDNIDFSFYGILWTTPSFASTAIAGGGSSGSDLWTEFGAGVAIHTMDGNLVVKPQLGITNGALLSGGVLDATETPTGTGGNFADGIVPSLTMNYSDDSFEAEFYGGYYAALRNRNDAPALDFLHTWVNAGAKVNDKFSLGAHYELLSNTRNNSGPTAVVYQWLGPYAQFSTSNGFFARFTAGADIEDGGDGDFYKLTAGFSF